MKKVLNNALELAGVLAAILCLIDCIVLPIVAALSPFLGLKDIIHGVNDQFSTLLVIVLCSVAFFPTFLKHRNLKAAGLLAIGIFFVFFANLIGDSTDKFIHVLLCLAGSACIIKANSLSRKLAAAAINASSAKATEIAESGSKPAGGCCGHNH